MSDRDKLIELLGWKYNCVDRNRCLNEQADYLLANGVIVSPCKVGDKVYRPSKYLGVVQFVITSFNMYESEMFFTDDSDNIIYLPDIGKTVFLTREEAEKALEGYKENS